MRGMKTIVQLGMHRSATSLVAKGLANEISMGKRMLMANKSQPKGHYEDLRAMNINIRLLKAAGGGWANPPSERRILAVAPQFAEDMEKFVAESSHEPAWGFKDPRTTLTVRA